MSRTQVKICGVIDPENAAAAVDLGADFLGFNFCARSPRYVSPAQACLIADAVRGRVPLVGVFVNASREEIDAVAEKVGLDLLQFSGDEGPADISPFSSRAIKVFRHGGDPGPAALVPYVDTWGLLFDAPHGTLYGGTGEAWGYEIPSVANRRIFLAGGLGPDNVRRAVQTCHPFAVDVCSRVESAPGIKDPELLRRLFQEVQHAQAPSAP